MNTLSKHILLIALLIATGLTASAQGTGPTITERLALTLVDYQSQYSAVTELNTYTNTLRLGQPADNDSKLLVDMLREGSNYLVFHRTDDQGNDVQFKRINMMTSFVAGQATEIGSFDCSTYTVQTYQDDNSQTHSIIALTSPWGGYLEKYTGGFYTFTTDGFYFTIPAGVNNAQITVAIHTSNSQYASGYFLINDEVYSVDANTTNIIQLSGTYSTGDVITFVGCDADGTLNVSPDLVATGKAVSVTARSVSYSLTPCIQDWDGTNGGAYTLLPNAQQTAAPGTAVNLANFGNIVDNFTASTADNTHPESYNYRVTYYYGANQPADPNLPTLTANPTTLTINGDNTQTASFSVSGSRLMGNVTVTDDANFTVNRASITPTNGTVNNVSVTVTAASGLTTETTGVITITSPGAQPVTVNVTYTPPTPDCYLIEPTLDLSCFSGTGWKTLSNGPWSSNNQGVNVQTYYFYLQNGSYSSDYIRYTVPSGISNATLTFVVSRYSSDNTSNNYLKVDGTAYQISKTQPTYIHVTGKSTGNTIEFKGCNQSGNNANSPYLTKIEVWFGEYNGN